MNITIVNEIAVIRDDGILLSDTQSALDIIGNVSYHANSARIIIFKENISPDFFRLSTGILGEILQKFVNYGVRLSIVGDFSNYTSKPLNDFIYESNKGGHIYFVPDEQSAIEKLRYEI